MLITVGTMTGALFGLPGLLALAAGFAAVGLCVAGFGAARDAIRRLKETPPAPAPVIQPGPSALSQQKIMQQGGLQSAFDDVRKNPQNYMRDVPVRESVAGKLWHKAVGR